MSEAEASALIGRVKCQACTDAVQFVKAGLESNSTESAIADKVFEICSNVGPKPSEPCRSMADKLGPQVFDMLVGTIDPNTACGTAGMC